VIEAFRGPPEGHLDEQIHCPDPEQAPISTTSCDNRYFANRMGQVPPGFRPHPQLKKFGNLTSLLDNPLPDQAPNGVDFWWDEWPGNTGNCWYDNQGPDGTRDSLTSDPPQAPAAGTSIPGFLPENCASSVGLGVPHKTTQLVVCFLQQEGDIEDLPTCDWFNAPSRPSTRAAAAEQRRRERVEQRVARSSYGADIAERLESVDGESHSDPG
jgi:hypothetical protein